MSFNPHKNLPDCMMPDGGECCAGHAAVCTDWHKQHHQIQDLTQVLQWIDTWISNPASAYSHNALEGLFGMTRDKIAAALAKAGAA